MEVSRCGFIPNKIYKREIKKAQKKWWRREIDMIMENKKEPDSFMVKRDFVYVDAECNMLFKILEQINEHWFGRILVQYAIRKLEKNKDWS